MIRIRQLSSTTYSPRYLQCITIGKKSGKKEKSQKYRESRSVTRSKGGDLPKFRHLSDSWRAATIHSLLLRAASGACERFFFLQIESPGESQGRRGIMTRRCFLRKCLIDNRSRRGEITRASERARLSSV